MPTYGYDGPVTTDQWAKMQQGLAVDYSAADATAGKVAANSSGCQVSAGVIGGWGVLDVLTGSVQVNLTAPVSGVSWWMICARRNWSTKVTTYVAIPAGTTRPATLPGRQTTPGAIDEQPLALVGWTAGQAQPTNVVDLRAAGMAGGQIIFDAQAMQYLTRAGRQVTLNAVEWRCLWSGSALTWTAATTGPVPKVCRGAMPADVNVAAGTWVRVVNYSVAAQSTAGMMNGATGRVTVPESGWYTVSGNGTWATRGSTSTRRILMVEVGSGAAGTGLPIAREDNDHSGYCAQSVADTVYLNAGEIVSMAVRSDDATQLRGVLSPATLAVVKV